MAFDHPGISSGEDPRGESDKDRSGLSWIAEYVFGPEYVFGHINEYFQDNGRIWTWMSFQASQPLIQNPKPRLERIPCPHASGGEPEAAFSASRRKLDLPNEAPHRPTTHRAGFQPSESRDDRG